MTWLTVLQFANYLIPLLIIPYIVRVLGADMFGKVSYAQNIISYLTIIINYGFEYSATQEIAINRDDKNKLRSIFWSVIRIKTLLLILSFFILAIFAFTFDKVRDEKVLYFYAALINIGFVLFPTWFFQGIEKMAKMTFFNFSIKLIGALLIILFIRNSSSYQYYLLILSLSYIIVGVFSLIYLIKKYDLKPSSNKENKAVIKGFPIFLNNIFSTLYTAAGLTMLGFFVSDNQLGIYSGAYRIIMAVLMMTSIPISIALFPTISRKFNESLEEGLRFYKKSILIAGTFALLCSIGVFLFSGLLVKILLGNGFEDSVIILRIFSALPFLVIIASMFTVQGMYGLQLQKYAPYVGFIVGSLSITLNYFLIKAFGLHGAAWSYVMAEMLEIALVFSLLIYKLKKSEVLK
jgi:PST family polysaccharide transporter